MKVTQSGLTYDSRDLAPSVTAVAIVDSIRGSWSARIIGHEDEIADQDAVRIQRAAAGGQAMKHPLAAVLWPEYAKLFRWKE